MTLVAIRVETDHAEILTDTLCGGEAHIGVSSKVTVLPHIDAAVCVRGRAELAGMWLEILHGHPAAVTTFDDLDPLAETLLPGIWDTVRDKDGLGRVIHVGWSAARGRMVAMEYCSENEFAGRDLTDLGFICHPDPSPLLIPNVPVSDDDWTALGELLYTRVSTLPALSGRQCPIGGDLILTRLDRGASSSRRIHTLVEVDGMADDWRIRDAMIGSVHWLGQLGPCICGSGQPWVVCCSAMWAPDDVCPCGLGRAFRDCHARRRHGA
jgi:hypothetical protein